MIKAIFFDYDGVLTPDKTGSYTICRYISNAAGIDFDKLSLVYKKFNNDLLYGKTSHVKIWDKLCAELDLMVNIKYLYDSFDNTPVNKDIFDLVKRLKTYYKTGIITDNKKDRMTALAHTQKLNELFNAIIVSADIGSGKDSVEIFNAAIKALDVKYDESVFIDNQQKNLIVPEKLGMKTIYYDHEKNDADALISKLKEFNMKI